MVSSICSADILFTWGSIVVSYIIYHRRHPERHRASGFRMPLPRIAPWGVLAFFVFIAFTLTLSPDTRIAAILSPFWFLLLAVLWQVVKRRLQKQHRPLTSEIPMVSPREIRQHFDDAEGK